MATQTDFAKGVAVLRGAGVEFIIVGGVARRIRNDARRLLLLNRGGWSYDGAVMFRHYWMISCVLGFFIGVGTVEAAGGNWKLVWSDEFDKAGLPDATKWDYETGFIRNNEAQYYTRARPENARVENGVLIIEARKEHFDLRRPRINTNAQETQKPGENLTADHADDADSERKGKEQKQTRINTNPAVRDEPSLTQNAERKMQNDRKSGREFAEYTSASLTTRGKASWTYGRIEVRAKLPAGRGTWPAIWTLGENRKAGWPGCGEIDIMEHVGFDPGKIHANIHTAKYNHTARRPCPISRSRK